MIKDTSKLLTSAVRTILKPIVRILLRNGIAFGTFSEIARKVYTDVAFEEFQPADGKKQSISHVSALTGLTRKDSKRLLESNHDEGIDDNHRYNRAARVISGWIYDKTYHNDQGEPQLLSVDQGNPSFASLVKKYSGDITTQSMLKVLKAAGSIGILDNQVKLVDTAYLPGKDSAEAIDILGDDSSELISTIDHNMTHGRDQRRFQRKVSERQVPSEAVEAFRSISSKKSQTLLEELDHWLSTSIDTREAKQRTDTRYVSVGIYYFEQSEN
jgi:hypothetical protein